MEKDQVANSGAKRRDWCGRRTQERRDEHLGERVNPTLLCTCILCSATLRVPLFHSAVTWLVWAAAGETKLAWAESCTALKAPEGQHEELQHWPCVSGSHSEGTRARSLV